MTGTHARQQRIRHLKYSGRSWKELISRGYYLSACPPPFSNYDLYPSNSDICPHHHSFSSYISASFSILAFLLISPWSYKPLLMCFYPCSSLCFQAGLHSSAGRLAAWGEDTRVTEGASILIRSAVSFTTSVTLHPMLPHSLATRKLQGSLLSSGTGVGAWAFVNEAGICLVLLTQKSCVKGKGSSIDSVLLEELLQNNEQQQVGLEAEVSKTLLQMPDTYLVNAKGYKRSVQKLAWCCQSKRISETCRGLDRQHHIPALHPSDPGHTSWAHTAWCFRVYGCVSELMKWKGEWVNIPWFQTVMFLSCKYFVLYFTFKLWLISEGALHTPECRLGSAALQHIPWDRHEHFAQMLST